MSTCSYPHPLSCERDYCAREGLCVERIQKAAFANSADALRKRNANALALLREARKLMEDNTNEEVCSIEWCARSLDISARIDAHIAEHDKP
jgi:hypothetical protein